VCGRFTRFTSASTIAETFSAIVDAESLEPSFNIAPTQEIHVVSGGDNRRVQNMRWGLVPSWAADISRASSMVNARIESVEEKPSFRNLLAKNRCIIPMNGYYEWAVRNVNGSSSVRQPYYFQGVSKSSYCHDEMIAVAAIWTTWGSGESSYISCAALTTEAIQPVSVIHHRMPVLLSTAGIDSWLSIDTAVDLAQFDQPTGDFMKLHAVSNRVNNVRTSGAQLTERVVVEFEQQESLF
jgi:putative SOS response-associated peptidase YedK